MAWKYADVTAMLLAHLSPVSDSFDIIGEKIGSRILKAMMD